MPIGNGYVGIWTTYRAPLSSVSAIALIGAVVCTQPVGAQSAGTAVTRGALNNGPVTRRVIGPATPIISAMPTGIRPSIIRGMLLLGKMRARTELDAMSGDDHRNTLITEVAGRTRDGIGFYQRLSDSELAGIGAVLIYLRTGIRTDAEIKTMSADEMRNTAIVEIAKQTGRNDLQGLDNLRLAQAALGPEQQFIRGVLLLSEFRTRAELDRMSAEDQRNTLITELGGRTIRGGRVYQGLNDADLAGAGAILAYLRQTGIRTNAAIKAMTVDEMRNTAIVEINKQTRRSDLQAMSNLDLALTALGVRVLPSWRGPGFARPGQHTMTLRVDAAAIHYVTRSFSDIPFIGTFTGRGTDCSRGIRAVGGIEGSGAAFKSAVGWGQIEGDGHPGSNSDQCAAWITRLTINFDVSQFASIPRKTVDRAILAYREEEARQCYGLLYTQGGYLFDPLPCWTNGEGSFEAKPKGCVDLKIPSEDWMRYPTGTRPIDWQEQSEPVSRAGPSSWDVTSLFRKRHIGGLGQTDTGFGYMLVGEPLNTDRLTADDNTRCGSTVSDVRLDVTYTVPEVGEQYDPDQPR